MSQFLLIDHSLKGLGGHHVEYAAHVARAAEAAGYRVLLATHRRFRAAQAFPRHWPVLPVFPFTTYSDYTIYDSRALRKHGQNPASNDKPGNAAQWCYARLRDIRFHLGRRRRIRGFRRGLAKLFSQVRLSVGDHVFVPTLSELDLLGLADFLANAPETCAADWHLQFHFQVFDGREPDYASQGDRWTAMQSVFEQAWPRLHRHRVHCYNTTAQLTEQYRRLGVAQFETLPYPVNPALHAARSGVDDARQLPEPAHYPRRLRLLCAGAIRPEKGSQELAAVAGDLWPDLLRAGRLQLVVQSNKPGFRLPLPDGGPRDAVEYAPHPLNPDEYVGLLRSADIGLLLYDSQRYYARCSGVLVELLSLGTPVIVTAGCWMAEQLAAAQFAHAEHAMRVLPTVTHYRLCHAAWDDPAAVTVDHAPPSNSRQDPREQPLGSRSGDLQNLTLEQPHSRFPDGARHPESAATELRWTLPDPARGATCQWSVTTPAEVLAASWRWTPPTQPGTYLRLELTQWDAHQRQLARQVQVVGQRDDGQPVSTLFHARANTRVLQLRWHNAYGAAPVALADFELRGLTAQQQPSRSFPLGAVGLIAAEASQVGHLARDLLAHWPHYRKTAATFAEAWRQFHNADRIVATLTQREITPCSADSRAA